MNAQEIAAVVEAERHRRGLSRDALAAAAMVHDRTIGRFEREVHNVTLATLIDLCEALGLEIKVERNSACIGRTI